MATNNGNTLTDIFHAGTFGNGSKNHLEHNFANEAQNDVVRLAKVPAGTKITDMKALFEAFGAARTLDIGYEIVDPASATADDPDYFTAGVADTGPTDVSAAGSIVFQFVPYEVTEAIYITATLAGAAGADAELDLLVDSVFEGNL